MMMLLLWSPLATPPLYPSWPPLPFSLLGRHYSFSQIWALNSCSVWNCYNLLCLFSSFLFFKLMQGSDSFRKISQLGETVCITAHAPPPQIPALSLHHCPWQCCMIILCLLIIVNLVYWLLSTGSQARDSNLLSSSLRSRACLWHITYILQLRDPVIPHSDRHRDALKK